MSNSKLADCLPSMGRGTARSVVEGGGLDTRPLGGVDATIAPSTACGGRSPRGGEDFSGDPIFTPALKVRFLDLLSQHGNVRVAAARVGVSRSGLYLARRRDHAFAAAWRAALVEARWHAEAVLAERALEGVEEEVYYRGEVIGSRRRYDTRLLLAHLARLDALCDGAEKRGEGDLDLAMARVAGIAVNLPAPSRAQHLARTAEAAGKRFEAQTAPPDPNDPYGYDPETATDLEDPVHTASREVDAAYEEAEARFDAAQAAFVATAVDEAAGEWDAAHALLAAAVDAVAGEGISPPADPLAIPGPVEVKSMAFPPVVNRVHCVQSAAPTGTGGAGSAVCAVSGETDGRLRGEGLECGARGHGGDRQQGGGDHGAGNSHGPGLSGSRCHNSAAARRALGKVRHAARLSTSLHAAVWLAASPLVGFPAAG